METKIKSYAKPVIFSLIGLFILLITLSLAIKAPKAYSFDTTNGNIQSFYASPQGYAAGCGNLFRAKYAVQMSKEIPESYYNIIPQDGYIPSSPLIIPIYGYLSQRGMHPSQFKFYSPESVNKDLPESLILRTMYDNNVVVIWYDPEKISKEDYEGLKAFGNENEGKVLIMPWLHYDSKTLPRDRTIAYAVFGMSQSCKTFNFEVIQQFISFTDEHPYEDKTFKPAVADLALPELL